MITAVEWLVEQMPTAFKNLTINKQLFDQAKEMEKEQIIETYNKAHSDGYKDIDKFGEQYYNETYKSE